MATTKRDPPQAAIDHVVATLPNVKNAHQFCDFKITCAGREWDVHRFVISLHSSVLAAACSKSFKEGEERTIDLTEDQAPCVAAMIEYFYHLDYSEDAKKGLGSAPADHVKICIIADKYNVGVLQQLAIDKFKKCMTDADVTEEELAEAALIAYEFLEPTKDIRARTVETVVEKEIILQKDTGVPAGPIERFMRTCPEFATDVVKGVMSKPMPDGLYERIDCCGIMYTLSVDESGADINHSRQRIVCFSCGDVLYLDFA